MENDRRVVVNTCMMFAASVGHFVSRCRDRSPSSHSHAPPAGQPKSIPSYIQSVVHVSTYDAIATFRARRQRPR